MAAASARRSAPLRSGSSSRGRSGAAAARAPRRAAAARAAGGAGARGAAAGEDPVATGAWPRRRRRTADEPGEPAFVPNEVVKYSLFGGSTAVMGATPDDKVDYSGEGAFDRFFLQFFARSMARRLGETDVPADFNGFVELSRRVVNRFDAAGCAEMTLGILYDVMPSATPAVFRVLFPPTKFSCEANAWVTTQFFSFLVGPSYVTEVLVNDTREAKRAGAPQRQMSRVQIKKCRWLEASGCAASCQSMCKAPTQEFFNDVFGLPVTMNPNYETLSCEMVFGQAPPPREEDVASAEGCLSACATGVVADDDPSAGGSCHRLPNFERYLAELEEARHSEEPPGGNDDGGGSP